MRSFSQFTSYAQVRENRQSSHRLLLRVVEAIARALDVLCVIGVQNFQVCGEAPVLECPLLLASHVELVERAAALAVGRTVDGSVQIAVRVVDSSEHRCLGVTADQSKASASRPARTEIVGVDQRQIVSLIVVEQAPVLVTVAAFAA